MKTAETVQKRSQGFSVLTLVASVLIGGTVPNNALAACTDVPNATNACWTNNSEVAPGDIYMLARTVNTKGSDPDYTRRFYGIVREFHAEWPSAIGIVGLQEVHSGLEDMIDCYGVTAADGWQAGHVVNCFGYQFIKQYDSSVTWAWHGTLGIIVGHPWKIASTKGWEIGKDSIKMLGNRSTRYLLEAKLENSATNDKVRVYVTHLSHHSDKSAQHDQRSDQIDNIIDHVTDRWTSGELPPLLIGDFNFHPNDERDNYNKLHNHFSLATKSFVGCTSNGNPTEIGVDHIWVGRRTSFPSNIGKLNAVRYHNTAGSAGKGIRLKDQAKVGGKCLPRLTDHDSPGISFVFERL